MRERLTDTFLLLFCEKNSDGSKRLRLKGKELDQRINTRLCEFDMPRIVEFVDAHPEIKEINLSYNHICDEGLEIFSGVFYGINHIKRLNLISCDITEQGVKALLQASRYHFMRLKILRLCGNKLGPEGARLLAQMLQNCPTLEYLDIGDTDQSPDGIDCIFNQVYRSQVKVLNISRVIPYHMFYQVDGTYLAENISRFFHANNVLIELHIQKSDLDAHDVEIMLVGLQLNTSLRFLDLGYNNICCVGVEFLAEWLKTRPNLLGLNIAGNKIKNHGATALSFGMPFSKLRYLDISYNKIENEGITAILNSIKKPFMLRYFFFWGNLFSHPANKIIERMLLSTVFQQEYIDVKVYSVDDVLYAASYPADKYKHKYYDIMDYGCAVELKIKRNRIEKKDDKPRALVKFQHVDRYPPTEQLSGFKTISSGKQ